MKAATPRLQPSDGKDAGFGESGIRKEAPESSLKYPWDAPTL